MKKRVTALIFCLLLILRLAVPAARAADSIFFMAAGIDVLPLEDATMPFWYNGYLYVASTIFTGRVNQVLEAAYLPYTASNVCILYSGGQALRFEEGKNYAKTPDGSTFSPGAILRDGIFFVPIGMVSGYFGFEYSTISLGNASYAGNKPSTLLWMRRPELTASLGMTDRQFASAAAYPMGERYVQYIQAQETVQTPEAPPPEEPLETPESGKTISLCFAAGDNTSALLDALDAYGAKAAFFCGSGFLEEHGDLLRRMTATGHTVGLLEDAGGEDIAARLGADNLTLQQATQGKTRLVLLEGQDPGAAQAAQAAGYCCIQPRLDQSGTALRSQNGADALLRRIAAHPGDGVTVWLGDAANAGGLRSFLSAAIQSENRFLALTETTS